MECYLARHCAVNWSSQLEALIVGKQLWSFDPCHHSLPLIQIVNKLITKSETQDKPHKTKHCEIYGQSADTGTYIVFAS